IGSFVRYARIRKRVADVRQQVSEQSQNACKQRLGQDEFAVAHLRCFDHKPAHARDTEDCLNDDGATEQSWYDGCRNGDQGDQAVTEIVAIETAVRLPALCAGCGDEIPANGFEHRAGGELAEESEAAISETEDGQHEVPKRVQEPTALPISVDERGK